MEDAGEDRQMTEQTPVKTPSRKAQRSLGDWIKSAKKMMKYKWFLPKFQIRKSKKKSEELIEARAHAAQLDIATEAAMARLPELVGKTELLDEVHLAELYRRQPPRVEGHPWTLAFSTTDDGYSLKTLYTKARVFQGPMLLVVRDTENQTFGALTSDPLRLDGHYYGTGESFLFRCGPPFQSYHWTGENPFFARGTPDGLEFGSGQGHVGLFVDADLYRGHTQRCSTFDNEPLTDPAEFKVVAVELWALGWDS